MKSEWKEATVNDICSLITDGAHNSPKSVPSGMYMASVKDFTAYGFDFSNCKQIGKDDYEKLKRQGCVPEFNDILVGKDGARYFDETSEMFKNAESEEEKDFVRIVTDFILQQKQKRVIQENKY